MGDVKKIVRIKESDLGKISVYVGYREETVIIIECDKLENPKWKDEEGNQVEEISCIQSLRLSVECKDIQEGENVDFHIFQEGDDINTDIPKASVYGTAENGVATSYLFLCPSMDKFAPSDEDIKLFFIAKAREYVSIKSKEITVKPIKLLNPKWKDEEGDTGKQIGRCYLDETIWLSVKYEYLKKNDKIIFELYRSINNNENEFQDKPLKKEKIITNGGSGICEVDWLYNDKDKDKHMKPDTFRNNLKVYFNAYIDGSSDTTKTEDSDVINVSNDCECQSFSDDKKDKYNKYDGLKPQTTRNTYGVHCDIMAWNKALKSGYDPRGFILDASKNIIKYSWDANMETVNMLYNKYFSKYNTIKNRTPLTGVARSIFFKYFLKFFDKTKYHTPPAGTAGFIFFKTGGSFWHVEFYDNTIIDSTEFKRYQTKGIRKAKMEHENPKTIRSNRYYVPLDKF